MGKVLPIVKSDEIKRESIRNGCFFHGAIKKKINEFK